MSFDDCRSGTLNLRFHDASDDHNIPLTRVASVHPLACRELREPAMFPERIDDTESLALLEVNVVMMPSVEVLERQMVIVESGIIRYVGGVDLTRLTEDMVVHEGRGRWVLPGMVDTHTHLVPSTSMNTSV